MHKRWILWVLISVSLSTILWGKSPRNSGNYIVSAGFGTAEAWNFVGLTREFGQGQVRFFATGGLGTILIGGGVVFYSNPGGSGFMGALTGGMVGYHANLTYQQRLGNMGVVSVGGSYGYYFMQYIGPMPVVAYSYRF